MAGRLAVRAELEGSGRSPAAFIGSLAGTGTISLENAQLEGLNPRVFDAVIRAVDLGVATDANRIRDFVIIALENGTLPAARAEAAISIAAGQARLSNVVTMTSGADLSASANVDLTDAGLDAVLTLSGAPLQPDGPRPVISIALKGPWHAPSRTVDASALASWLALRAVEQQAKQIDTMERQAREREEERERLQREATAPATGAVPASPLPNGDPTTNAPSEVAPPLPPAINVVPAPKPRAPPRAEGPAAAPARTAAPRPAPPPIYPPLDLLGTQR